MELSEVFAVNVTLVHKSLLLRLCSNLKKTLGFKHRYTECWEKMHLPAVKNMNVKTVCDRRVRAYNGLLWMQIKFIMTHESTLESKIMRYISISMIWVLFLMTLVLWGHCNDDYNRTKSHANLMNQLFNTVMDYKVFFSLHVSSIAALFWPPPCTTVSASEIEISSSNCEKIVFGESELLSTHLSHFSCRSRHDKWAATVCLSFPLPILTGLFLSGAPLSWQRLRFLIYLQLFWTSSNKWPNQITFRAFFHLPLRFSNVQLHRDLRHTLNVMLLTKQKQWHIYTS